MSERGPLSRAETDRLLDELDALLREARPVPLTDQVRLDKRKAQLLLYELREHLTAERRGR